jgi:hypothetical protein
VETGTITISGVAGKTRAFPEKAESGIPMPARI